MGYDRKATGCRIRHAMIDAGLNSATDLANRVGVSRETVSGWIAGTKGISLKNACRLCDVLGLSLDKVVVR